MVNCWSNIAIAYYFTYLTVDNKAAQKSFTFVLLTFFKTKTASDSKSRNEAFDCDQCGYQATQKSSLKIHIQSIHEGVKYPCNEYDYQSTRPGNLKNHIQAKHEGIKYACDQCDYQLNSERSLYCHIKSKHKVM